jgi:hypothetical protein
MNADMSRAAGPTKRQGPLHALRVCTRLSRMPPTATSSCWQRRSGGMGTM